MNAMAAPSAAASTLRAVRRPFDAHRIALSAGLYAGTVGSAVFWREAWHTGALSGAAGAWTVVALAIAVCAAQVLVAALLIHGRAARVLAMAWVVVTALFVAYAWRYTVYLDDDMLRGVLHTDVAEARELLTPGVLGFAVALAAPMLAWLWRLQVPAQPCRPRLWQRARLVAGAGAVLVLGLGMAFQTIAGFMHSHRDLRHLLAPANILVSAARVAMPREQGPRQRAVVGADARLATSLAGRRPRVLVLVVGETVRAANWGLSGYARQTTPRLAAIGPVNFTEVTACGSATEVSLPCMFSAVGRRDYDQDRIESSDSLLHVLQRAGIDVRWRDNQTGCKGVCDGLPFESFRHAASTGACAGEGCLDRILLRGLDALIDAHPRDLVLVLHPLGNHGPAYFRRTPARLQRFQPVCRSDALSECDAASIVNAYDNAVLATDDLLASAIQALAARRDRDTALLFVSDHGESLGEDGLWLHGVPYAVAPRVQTRVPMVLWTSSGFAAGRGLDMGCLRARARRPASHDHLFHTVLGLMQVATTARDASYDLTAACARPPVDAAVRPPDPGHALVAARVH